MEAEAPAGVLTDQAIVHIGPRADQLTTLETITAEDIIIIMSAIAAKVVQAEQAQL